MTTIPPVDLARQYKQIREETDLAVLDILHSGRYIGGQVVKDFEEQLANYTGVKEAVACNSGTDALYLALRALNIGEGDEVITSPFTFIATAETITQVGATPIFIDIDLKTFNLDPNQIETAITPRTKAIIPVHLFGKPVNLTQVKEIAAKHNLFVIEDCAQATGAKWQNERVGSIGHIGCFSFFPTKNLGTCGDGGAITTNDEAIAAKIRMIKEHGSKVRYRHDVVGINSRLDAIQAAILQVKLRYLDEWNERRKQVSQNYQQLLAPLPNLTLPQGITGGDHVWNQYTILVKNQETGEQSTRDKLREQLVEKEIISMIYYPIPLHLQPVYQGLGYQQGSLPNAEQACKEVLSLPMFPDLTFEEQQQVAYALKECL
ncbi:MAG: DegT/DnrJ/EryC1/StrS family aminotransferase [Microcystaceae cyanobacterium]